MEKETTEKHKGVKRERKKRNKKGDKKGKNEKKKKTVGKS